MGTGRDPGRLDPPGSLKKYVDDEGYSLSSDATVVALEELGSQRLDDPQTGCEYHRFYWCRVTLADQVFPRAESTLRHVVSPTDFLDALQWGRSDPKAPILLELALQAERRFAD